MDSKDGLPRSQGANESFAAPSATVTGCRRRNRTRGRQGSTLIKLAAPRQPRVVGVKSVTDLRKLGAAKAFLDVRAAGLRPSLNLLWALEGALTAMPWHKVVRTERTRLLFEVEDLKAIGRWEPIGSGQ